MQSKNSNRKNRVSYYARVRTGSGLIKTVLLAALILSPLSANEAAFEAAVTALKNSDLKTKFDGLEKIKAFRTPEAAQLLTRSAVKERDANFRLAVLDQLAVLQIPVIIPDLASLLRDKVPAVRQRTARVIGMLGGPLAEAALLPAVAKEKDPSVKAALIQALGLCGSKQSEGVLNAAAADADPAVRANAVHAHKRIKGKEGK